MRSPIVLAFLVVGCGGGSRPPAIAPGSSAGVAAMPAGDPWIAMTASATFSFDDRIEGGDAADDVKTIVATVTSVEPRGDARVIRIAWTANGEPLNASLPDEVIVGATTVTFNGLEFPLATAGELPDGRYVSINRDGATCYGEGPAPGNDQPCDDVCFADLCVHPAHGLVGGAGTWWPNYVVFARADLR